MLVSTATSDYCLMCRLQALELPMAFAINFAASNLADVADDVADDVPSFVDGKFLAGAAGFVVVADEAFAFVPSGSVATPISAHGVSTKCKHRQLEAVDTSVRTMSLSPRGDTTPIPDRKRRTDAQVSLRCQSEGDSA